MARSLTTTDVARLGPSAPSYGVLVVLGTNDTLVHTPIERDAYDTLGGRIARLARVCARIRAGVGGGAEVPQARERPQRATGATASA